ncbi:hypothetical protein SLS58_009919 [Diplodia intermedia]|uniref:Uncharacterized protein n=1 Tax=Diplodia intermedia TaxID=856260 RepID=A0ABR3TA31_9PEZI
MATKCYLVPDAPIVAIILKEYDQHDFNGSSEALTNWLNLRWGKSGYQIKAEVVHSAVAGRGDLLDGAFLR